MAGKAPLIAVDDDASHKQSLQFLYPYGCTVNVVKPAAPLLSSGSVSFPQNRPVCAFFRSKEERGGRVMVVGSGHMFSDSYLGKEENGKLLDVMLQLLTSSALSDSADGEIRLNAIDASDPDICDYFQSPDIANLAEELKCCLQESEEVPRDFGSLFDDSLYVMDTNLVPVALE